MHRTVPLYGIDVTRYKNNCGVRSPARQDVQSWAACDKPEILGMMRHAEEAKIGYEPVDFLGINLSGRIQENLEKTTPRRDAGLFLITGDSENLRHFSALFIVDCVDDCRAASHGALADVFRRAL